MGDVLVILAIGHIVVMVEDWVNELVRMLVNELVR
jgi:hypothetical protein